MEEVRGAGGTVRIFSSMHVSGEQLAQLSGIAAVLRFPLPDPDSDAEAEEEEDTDEEELLAAAIANLRPVTTEDNDDTAEAAVAASDMLDEDVDTDWRAGKGDGESTAAGAAGAAPAAPAGGAAGGGGGESGAAKKRKKKKKKKAAQPAKGDPSGVDDEEGDYDPYGDIADSFL